MNRFRLIQGLTLYLILATGLQACGQNTASKEPPQSLEDIYRMASQSGNIRSFLVSRHGELISEKYFRSYDRDSLDHLRSATKTIMATLIGIAVDRGMISSVDDPISNYISEVPDDKQSIRIKHLLNMTSGFKWSEGTGYNDHNKMIDSGNPLEYMLGLPMVARPGSKWNYSSGDIHMLSVVLSNASDMSTEQFARKYLFDPLGIHQFKWQKFGDGYTAGGSRLELKPKDMLRIGQMFAQGGTYNGERIVSKSYLDISTNVLHVFNAANGVSEGYGYGWWTINLNGDKAAMAMGYGGQMIAVIPGKGLVIVVTHKWKVNGQTAGEQENRGESLAEALWQWSQRG
ncbi:MAG: serine hydrolase [Roseivirga sp.]|nr:serine hydrolase [Roseivirga sp.]